MFRLIAGSINSAYQSAILDIINFLSLPKLWLCWRSVPLYKCQLIENIKIWYKYNKLFVHSSLTQIIDQALPTSIIIVWSKFF